MCVCVFVCAVIVCRSVRETNVWNARWKCHLCLLQLHMEHHLHTTQSGMLDSCVESQNVCTGV